MLNQAMVTDEGGHDVPYVMTTIEKVNRLWEMDVAGRGQVLTDWERDFIADVREERLPMRARETAEVDRIWEERSHRRGAR